MDRARHAHATAPSPSRPTSRASASPSPAAPTRTSSCSRAGRDGLTEQDMKLVLLQHADGKTALERGDVDAWAGLDPMMAAAEVEDGARLFFRNAGRQHLRRPERARGVRRRASRAGRARARHLRARPRLGARQSGRAARASSPPTKLPAPGHRPCSSTRTDLTHPRSATPSARRSSRPASRCRAAGVDQGRLSTCREPSLIAPRSTVCPQPDGQPSRGR